MDRYVGRTLLASWAATLLFIVVLFVIVDLLMHVPDALAEAQKQGLTLFEFIYAWVRFHLLFQPFLFVTVAPFATVIASMFAVTRLMAANELNPMVFTGRSMFRILLPVLKLGFLSAVLMGLVWEFVIPPISKPLNDLRQVLDPERSTSEIKFVFVHAPDNPRQVLLAERYMPDLQRMEKVHLLNRGTQRTDTTVIEADAAEWNPVEEDWDLTNGRDRSSEGSTPRLRLGVRGLDPDLLWRTGKLSKMTVELSYSELLELRAMRPNRSDYRLAFHQHLTFPLANIVLLLLALPFAVSFERGSKVGRVMVAIAVCAAYLIVDLICQNLGRREWLHPVVAAWVPTILFGSLGAVMFAGIRT